MRNALTLLLALAGIACFIAGDAMWLMQRRRDEPLDLRATGGLITLGAVLFLVAILVRPA